MLASVIVPARDAAGTLPTTLAALAAQELDGELEVIVVDDGSRDGTATLAEHAGATVIRHDRPLGAGAARNRGAAAARGDALAFTDADCAPTPGWLDAALRALEQADLVQGRVEEPPGARAGPFDRTLRVTRPSGLFESANLIVRRELFERLGGFGEGVPVAAGSPFGEDVAFGWRARRAGARIAFCDKALVHHAVVPRGPLGLLRERRRDGHFAALARGVPELRETFFHRRWFLSRRSAAFAAAAAGALVAAAVRRPALAAPATLPYGRIVAGDLRGAGPRVALVYAAADAVGFAALLRGSVRARTLLL